MVTFAPSQDSGLRAEGGGLRLQVSACKVATLPSVPCLEGIREGAWMGGGGGGGERAVPWGTSPPNSKSSPPIQLKVFLDHIANEGQSEK